MRESKFQAKLIKDIKERLPDCIVLKNDPTYLQGIPDLTIFNNDRWATLEVKKSVNASHQPNQDYYVEMMDRMSFSRFVYPENRDAVFSDLIDYLED